MVSSVGRRRPPSLSSALVAVARKGSVMAKVANLQTKRPYVPERCAKSPNCQYDGNFGIYTCGERDRRCHYHGPVFILDQDGRHFECRKKTGASD